MATPFPLRNKIKDLKEEYDKLKFGKIALLNVINETEISESVYNSNAIENSTLTLKETEKILLEMEVSRDINLREVFEAKNLARIIEFMRVKSLEQELTKEIIVLLHKMLIGNIKEDIAGRFRKENEYVRIGSYIAPSPENIERLIDEIIIEYSSDHETYLTDKIAKFHLDFENTHPFIDGNGRIGRAIINYQLQRFGFPTVIIRDKEKKQYYSAFTEYRDIKKANKMEKIIDLSLTESLHKRIAYLKGESIIPLAEYAKGNDKSINALINAAKRQTIPAFREKGIWKIGVSSNIE